MERNTSPLFGEEAYKDAKVEETTKKTNEVPLVEAPLPPSNVLPKKLEPYEDLEDDLEDYKDPERFETPKKYRVSPEWFIANKNGGSRSATIKAKRETGKKEENFIDDLKADLLTLKGQVIFILAEFDSTRNSDDALEYKLLQVFYWVQDSRTFGEYWKLDNRPSRDNIKRIRARLNQKGYFLPTNPDVLKARWKLEGVFANHFTNN